MYPLLPFLGVFIHVYHQIFQILAMIEEAAGTRMYECKKISAQKTIEKKEAKLKEIQTVCQTSKLSSFDQCVFCS